MVVTDCRHLHLLRIIVFLFLFAISNYFCNFAPEIKEERKRIMARPIRETPVLKGEDAFNFEWRRLMVDHMSKEERAENRRKLEERIANARNKIEICF